MIDVIIACLVALELPDMILWGRMQQTGLSGGAAMAAALSRPEFGGLSGGMACLLLAEVLAVLLILKTIGLLRIEAVNNALDKGDVYHGDILSHYHKSTAPVSSPRTQ